jgi:hypothetical protein
VATSKQRILDAFSQAHEELVSLDLTDEPRSLVGRLHRAFTELRHHDSDQARTVEDLRASLVAREKKLDDLRVALQKANDSVHAVKGEQGRIVQDLRASLVDRDKKLEELRQQLQHAERTNKAAAQGIQRREARIKALEQEAEEINQRANKNGKTAGRNGNEKIEITTHHRKPNEYVIITPPTLDNIRNDMGRYISQAVESHLKKNPSVRVRCALPIVEGGQTIAVHLWLESRYEEKTYYCCAETSSDSSTVTGDESYQP